MKSGILASEVDEREGKRPGLRSKSLQQGFQTRDSLQYRDFSKKVIQIGFFFPEFGRYKKCIQIGFFSE